MPVLILTQSDAMRAIDMAAAVEASERAFVAVAAGRAAVPRRPTIEIEDGQGSASLFMPGYLPGEGALGAKVVSVFPGNPARGLPATLGAILLISPETGEPLALMDGTWLTSLRTGAGAGVATRRLAREDARTLALLGAGGIAAHQAEAVLAVRPGIERVLVWSRTRARAEALVARLSAAHPGRAFEAVDSPEAAVRAADVITACTRATEPVLLGVWVRPGTHVNLVGAHAPHEREADDELLRRSAVRAVDMRDAALVCGELSRPIEAGAVAAEAFVDIGLICAGQWPGRRSAEEITWFKSVGLAAQDLATARLVLDRARALGLGTRVDL